MQKYKQKQRSFGAAAQKYMQRRLDLGIRVPKCRGRRLTVNKYSKYGSEYADMVALQLQAQDKAVESATLSPLKDHELCDRDFISRDNGRRYLSSYYGSYIKTDQNGYVSMKDSSLERRSAYIKELVRIRRELREIEGPGKNRKAKT